MENIQKMIERKRRRCRRCGKRITLYIFERDGKTYCKCLKCFAEGRFFKKD